MNRRSETSPSESALQARFNLKPYLAARHMKPQVYPSMDATMEWPLVPNIQSDTMDGNAPTEVIQTLVPAKPGQHQLCTGMSVLPRSNPVAGDRFLLIVRWAPNRSFTIGTIRLANFPVVDGAFPLVGGILITTAANGGIVQGIPHVYLSEGWTLEAAYLADPASSIAIEWNFFSLPSSQPMTTLLNY